MYGDGRNKTHTLRRGGLRFDFSAVAKDPREVQDDFGYGNHDSRQVAFSPALFREFRDADSVRRQIDAYRGGRHALDRDRAGCRTVFRRAVDDRQPVAVAVAIRQ